MDHELHPDAKALITRFRMAPIPGEGGWFCETWRSPMVLPQSITGRPVAKPAGTSIPTVFCHGPQGFSALHRLATTDVGAEVQVVVPAGTWMGGRAAEIAPLIREGD